MGFIRKFYQQYDFMLTIISGKVDDKNLFEHVLALNTETEGVIGLKELADARNMTDLKSLSVKGVTRCAAAEIDRPGSKLALLIPRKTPMVYGMARAFQVFSDKHREEVKIFTDIEDAVDWLADNEADSVSISDFVVKMLAES